MLELRGLDRWFGYLNTDSFQECASKVVQAYGQGLIQRKPRRKSKEPPKSPASAGTRFSVHFAIGACAYRGTFSIQKLEFFHSGGQGGEGGRGRGAVYNESQQGF